MIFINYADNSFKVSCNSCKVYKYLSGLSGFIPTIIIKTKAQIIENRDKRDSALPYHQLTIWCVLTDS